MKMKFTILFFVLLVVIQNVKAQSFDWAKQLEGTDVNFAAETTTDALGNVYTVGVFYGTIDCNPGLDTYNLISDGSSDVFISKLDPSGNFLWAKQIGGSGAVGGLSITIDAIGGIYIGGSFEGTIEFVIDGDDIALVSGANEDAFIAKLDASGNLIWFKQFEGTSNSYGRCVSIGSDNLGNVYAIGDFAGTIDFDPGVDTFELSLATEDNNGVFITKLDSSGEFLWAKKFAPAYFFNDLVYASSIAVDSEGNVYTSGYFYGTIDFNPGTGNFNLTGSPEYNGFITKLDTNGDFVWAKLLFGSQSLVSSLSLDAAANIYAVGSFKGDVYFNPEPDVFSFTSTGGQPDGFISKFNSSGDFIWARHIEGYESQIHITSNTIDVSGNAYITGHFVGSISFPAPSSGGLGFGLSSIVGADVFMAKSDANGDFLWVKKLELIHSDPNDFISSSSITTDNTGNIYTSGGFRGLVNFDSDPDEFHLSSPDYYNTFVHKLRQSLVGIVDNIFVEQIGVYPNPSAGQFNITFEEEMSDVSIIVRNALGQKIMEQSYSSTKNIELNFSGAPGVYFAEIESNNQTTVKRIIKE